MLRHAFGVKIMCHMKNIWNTNKIIHHAKTFDALLMFAFQSTCPKSLNEARSNHLYLRYFYEIFKLVLILYKNAYNCTLWELDRNLPKLSHFPYLWIFLTKTFLWTWLQNHKMVKFWKKATFWLVPKIKVGLNQRPFSCWPNAHNY